jgi:hypothetical protein
MVKSGCFRKPCADFDTVIVTSMNEGKFPAGKSQNSFIPYDVKRVCFTFKEKDAFTPIILSFTATC